MKIKVGIFFGGPSREREISFAGGRTVYDNLDKSLFTPVPIFVDSFRNFILLDWEYIYKGSIRDFYPPVTALSTVSTDFQLYAESLGAANASQQAAMANQVGRLLTSTELGSLIDVAFLALHGEYGEDGQLQQELSNLGIAYTGSGVAASQIGIDKAVQKELMSRRDFASTHLRVLAREAWLTANVGDLYEEMGTELGFPFVVRPARQGSSIGVSIIEQKDGLEAFERSVNRAFFREYIPMNEWADRTPFDRTEYLKMLGDLREGVGFPVRVTLGDTTETIYRPERLLDYLDTQTSQAEHHSHLFILEGVHTESSVILESFISGKEFSCIVLRTETGQALALPPTEIIKGGEVFDYRSKYLPGLSRKETPIHLPDEQVEAIRRECERLFNELGFQVYARIDGFYGKEGAIFLNDPNTTSGMLPSSFFFHQAAEIGLNPSQFLTYIIRISLQERMLEQPRNQRWINLGQQLDALLDDRSASTRQRRLIAVILGGDGAERHISVESGRNVYEKLGGSEKYEPIPVFLTRRDGEYVYYRLPVNLLLKDNADDIRDKILHWQDHPLLTHIRQEATAITQKYAGPNVVFSPQPITLNELADLVDGVFIALHGRPGEDGQLQKELEDRHLPYNGSSVASSELTIDKLETLQALKKAGLPVAKQLLQRQQTFAASPEEFYDRVEKQLGYPLIAKPVDDGCSAAVKVIHDRADLEAYTQLMFGVAPEQAATWRQQLKLKPKEEFPAKDKILFEERITAKGADKFVEITGGILTRYAADGSIDYQNFEPSETPSKGEVLSLEEKFLAGEGQNITPARLATAKYDYAYVASRVKADLEKAARTLGVEGYCRIDAFVRVYNDTGKVETLVIEVNSLPGMTPATAIFHQAALVGCKPYEFIDQILNFGFAREQRRQGISMQVETVAAAPVVTATPPPAAYIPSAEPVRNTASSTSYSTTGAPRPSISERTRSFNWQVFWDRAKRTSGGLLTSMYFWKNMIAIALFVLVCVFMVQWFLGFYTQHGDSVQVHNYVGMSLDEAQQKARSRGFRLEVIDSSYSPNMPPMQVKQQDPVALSRVKENRTVYLSINGSTAKEQSLPLLSESGYEYNRYTRKLEVLDIRYEIKEERFDAVQEDNTILYFFHKDRKITDADLQRGVKVPQGELLQFVVTVRQTNEAQIPDLVCKKYDAAKFLIDGARLTLGEVRGDISNRSGAWVVRQDPPYEAGVLLEKGTPITLYLSAFRPNNCDIDDSDLIIPEEELPDSPTTEPVDTSRQDD